MMKMYQAVTVIPMAGWNARFTYFVSAGILMLAVMCGDYWLFGHSLLEKGAPDFGVSGWVRTAGSVVVALLFFQSLKAQLAFGTVRDKQTAYISQFALAVLTLMLASAATVAIFPEILNDIVREGQPVGYITDVVLIVALVYLAIAYHAACCIRSGPGRIFGLPAYVVIALMVTTVFLILMEEMSWGQHLFGWSAGGVFEGNAQNETNLHNFYTYQFEAVYYSTAFIIFVVLPWAWPQTVPEILRPISFYVPPKIFAVAALPLAGFLYEEWNLVAYQVWFVSAVLIGLHILVNSRRSRQSFRLTGMIVASLLAAQAVFLTEGHRMVDGYELSEIRELLIAMMIAAYSTVIARRFALVVAADRSK